MSTWAPGNVVLGEYTIEQELGRGGMGRVWLVTSQSTGRHFAVKQALIRDDKHRKAFLIELQTWIDLPEHPNIVPCRFFRTVGDEIVIFADYIEGGSLADWIAKGKLTGLEQILDVAIQFAWGLHAIHERGLIHQDVKPGNVLMTPEGVPMVTDFGLARAKKSYADGDGMLTNSLSGEQSVAVSSGGYTPAYVSPEQRSGQPITRKTDIWSWGVSVMDMFMGDISCPLGGQIAADVLADFYENNGACRDHLDMFPVIRNTLAGCFRRSPLDRWPSFVEATTAIRSVYERIAGKQHVSFAHSASIQPAESKAFIRYCGATSWSDPQQYITQILTLLGDIDTSRQASVEEKDGNVSDIILFERAAQLASEAITSGRTDLLPLYGTVQIEKGYILETVNDVSGAIAAYDAAIDFMTRCVQPLGKDSLRVLAKAYEEKATRLEYSEAILLYDEAIGIMEQLVNDSPDNFIYVAQLASAKQRKGATHLVAGTGFDTALHLLDEAIIAYKTVPIWERHESFDIRDVLNGLAIAYTNKAIALARGLPPIALSPEVKAEIEEQLDMAIEIRSHLWKAGMHQLTKSYVRNLDQKAALMASMGRERVMDAIATLSFAVNTLKQSQTFGEIITGQLGHLYENIALILLSIRDPQARRAMDSAIAHYRKAIDMEGDLQCASRLTCAIEKRDLLFGVSEV
jgi:serine/threonine protein kinase